MVNWLTTHDYALDIQVVNAKLETGLHCAIQTHSSATLQVGTPTDSICYMTDIYCSKRVCPLSSR